MAQEKDWLQEIGRDLGELRTAYRERVAAAVAAAQGYDGREASYKSVMGGAEALESWMQSTFGLPSKVAVPAELERALAQTFEVTEGGSVNEVLTVASDRFTTLLAEQLEQLKIKKLKIHGVIFPPGEGKERTADLADSEGEDRVDGRRPLDRLTPLLRMLNENGIFVDDLLIGEGDEPVGLPRSESYLLLEIPRLNRQVLVCNEVNEGTYVILGVFDAQVFVDCPKDKLLERFPGRVTMVVHRETAAWLEAIRGYLFRDNPIEDKLDLELREQLVLDLRRQFPDSQSWFNRRSHAARRAIQSCGKKLGAISKSLGGPADPYTELAFLRLGLSIYGAQDTFLQRRIHLLEGDEEVWRTVLKEKFPVEADFLKASVNKFPPIEGFKLDAILTLLKIPRAGSERQTLLNLGQFVFGESEALQLARRKHEAYLTAAEDVPRDKGKYRNAFLKRFPKAEDWMDFSTYDRQRLFIEEVSLHQIMQGFGLIPEIGRYKESLDFALLMYEGEERDKIVIELEAEKCMEDPALLRAELFRRHPSVEEWIALPWPARKSFRVGRHNSLGLVAGALGFSGQALKDDVSYLSFVQMLFPEHAGLAAKIEALRALDREQAVLGKGREQWGSFIKQHDTATSADWDRKEGWVDRRRLIAGRSLQWIAREVFGFEVSGPVISPEHYRGLGEILFL